MALLKSRRKMSGTRWRWRGRKPRRRVEAVVEKTAGRMRRWVRAAMGRRVTRLKGQVGSLCFSSYVPVTHQAIGTSSEFSRYLSGAEIEDFDELPESRIQRLGTDVFDGKVGFHTQLEVDLIKRQWADECAICFEQPMIQPALFPACAHIFCGTCAIKKVRKDGMCPYCGEESGAFVWQLRLLDMQLD